MLKIKKLHLFMIRSFLGPLLITYFICLFIFLMQTLWRYVSVFVGKGLDQSVIIEFFWYSALSMTPMALPLAILLASLMEFGDMGEHLELLSMKASGISLFRIMRPILIVVLIISFGSFMFSNEVLPWSNNKLYSLIAGVKQTKPELEIPENQFYNAGSFVIKAVKKNKETGMLYDLMLYDHSNNQNSGNITYADSGRLDVTTDKKYMVVTLFHGKTLMDFQWGKTKQDRSAAPFRRDEFERREILADMTGNFEERDRYGNHSSSMNVQKLTRTVDSLSQLRDSCQIVYMNRLLFTHYFNKMTPRLPVRAGEYERTPPLINWRDSLAEYTKVDMIATDSIMRSLSKDKMVKGVDNTIKLVRKFKDDINYTKGNKAGLEYTIRRLNIEWHQKFTLPFACIVFFFIGAPLGAIIRKGGLGMPVVISIILFITYYMINNSGYKLASDNTWSTFSGMWLSSFVLLPFGIFLTYKAAKDSSVMNKDTYEKFFKKIKKWTKKLKK